MYTSINTVSAFRDEFKAMRRADQFSYDALGLLFEHLEAIDYQELDVVALCCEYSEDSPDHVAAYYSINIEGMSDEEARAAVLEYLEDHTYVVGVTKNGDIVYSSEF